MSQLPIATSCVCVQPTPRMTGQGRGRGGGGGIRLCSRVAMTSRVDLGGVPQLPVAPFPPGRAGKCGEVTMGLTESPNFRKHARHAPRRCLSASELARGSIPRHRASDLIIISASLQVASSRLAVVVTPESASSSTSRDAVAAEHE